MKRPYENPTLNWLELCPEDILTTSPGDCTLEPKNELEPDWN